MVTDYHDFDSGDETHVGLQDEANPDAKKVASDPDSDTDDDGDQAKQTDSDDSDHENPLVTVPVDADISDDEDEVANAAISELKATATTVDGFSTSKTTADNKGLKIEKEADQQNHASSEDEDSGNAKYEVTGDFDFEEPSFDDWLVGGKEEKNAENKDKDERETDEDVANEVNIFEV